MPLPAVDPAALPPKLREIVQREIAGDEILLWLAQPSPWRFARGSIILVIFGIPWTAITGYLMLDFLDFQLPTFSRTNDIIALFLLPFVLIGVALLCSPLIMRVRAKRTAYAITDRRAIVFDGGWSMRIQSFQPHQIPGVARVQRADGSGDVVFEREVTYDIDGNRQTHEVGFFGVAQVREVYRLLDDLAIAGTAEEHGGPRKEPRTQ